MRRSIALVYPACHRRGGVERCVREVARALADRYDVTFVGDEFDPNGMEGVSFDPVGGRRLPTFLGLLSFRGRASRRLRERRDDVVVTWGAQCPPGDILAVASVHRAWLRHGRAIPTRFGRIPNRVRYALPQHAVRLYLERSYFRSRSNNIVCVLSEQNLEEVAQLYNVPLQRMVIIPNGYAGEEFSAERAAELRARQRAQLGLGETDVLVLLVANELHRKGFATLLEAVAEVGDPRVKVAVVGRAPIEAYMPQIRQRGLGDRVRWYGPSDEVAVWYAAADLFVMPSQYEAYPLVVIEALACGLPVITTAFAGSLDAVQPGVNGLLLEDPSDALELARLLRQGLNDDVRASWREAAPASVARLEWRRIAERYAEQIETIAISR